MCSATSNGRTCFCYSKYPCSYVIEYILPNKISNFLSISVVFISLLKPSDSADVNKVLKTEGREKSPEDDDEDEDMDILELKLAALASTVKAENKKVVKSEEKNLTSRSVNVGIKQRNRRGNLRVFYHNYDSRVLRQALPNP